MLRTCTKLFFGIDLLGTWMAILAKCSTLQFVFSNNWCSNHFVVIENEKWLSKIWANRNIEKIENKFHI